jgi:plastocyanin
MPRTALTVLACLALASGAALAGCGSDDDTASTPATPPPAAEQTQTPQATEPAGDEVKVGMKNIKFVPHDVTAKVGQKIVWTNGDAVPHNVTATDGADFKSDDLKQGDTFEFTPTKAGDIAYVCTIHNGQDGTITVTK